MLRTNNKKWLHHLVSLGLAALLFLPWLFMFMVQVRKVQHAFWAPEVSFSVIRSCFTIPFTEQFWTTNYSIALMILVYGLIIFTVIKSFSKSFSEYRLPLWLSLSVFLGTLLMVAIISLFSQPILFSRYVMAIVTMLMVPVTILFIHIRITWLKILFMVIILFLGIRVSVSTFYFSYGPYKQTVEYINTRYPDIHKVLHLTEITAGPMLEYNGNTGIGHYWLKAKMSNVDAFTGIHQYHQPNEFLQPGEEFCVVQYGNLELNKENLDLVLSESELMKRDTVTDNKVEYGAIIQVYHLTYKGK